eukprot:589430-Pelagomonas_calceolata.AAC.2
MEEASSHGYVRPMSGLDQLGQPNPEAPTGSNLNLLCCALHANPASKRAMQPVGHHFCASQGSPARAN